MRIAAVICEYNPFHNGHKYQLDLIKKEYDAVVCVMSGSFVERGDVAIYDKWVRARAALQNGADLILEMPALYSLSSANGFAMGGVEILNALGCVDALFFGSEVSDIKKLLVASELLLNEAPDISLKIKELLGKGFGYPAARAMAYDGIIDNDILSLPNNLLAVEYISALKRTNSKIEPKTHQRTVGYHDTSREEFASATHIRELLSKDCDISKYVPFDYSSYDKYDINKLTDILRYRLLYDGENAFSQIPDSEQGMYERFLNAVRLDSFIDIVNAVVTKRYTRSRLSRIALRYILNIGDGYRSPEYIRVLGATKIGCKILALSKQTSTLPIITKAADYKDIILKSDLLATDIAELCSESYKGKGRDFTTSPIIIQ